MSIATNGDVTVYYESFGRNEDPVLLLINGLGSQCINYAVEWCEMFAAGGYRVVRYDNRDVGLSSKLDGVTYCLTDMAADALAVLDAVGADRAHVMGCSMGGMIAHRLAIDHPERLLSMTSVMSRTGEPGYGESSPEALAMLMAAPATSKDEYVTHQIEALHIYGSKPEWLDDDFLRTRAQTAYDRCFCPEGVGRQMTAVMRDGSRTDALRTVSVPVLVLHGSRDVLIAPSGGRRTAELIPGARYVEIEGMGHDYPPAVWEQWVAIWSDFARSAVSV